MNTQVVSELIKLGTEASLPPVPAAKIRLAMETLSLSRDIFQTIMETSQASEPTKTKSGHEYHQKIHPYLMMTELTAHSTKLFLSIKEQLPPELKLKFEDNFKTLLTGFMKFNQQVVDRLTEELSTQLAPLDRCSKLGYYLSALAELSYLGEKEEQIVTQTCLSRHTGITTAAVTGARDGLVKAKYADEFEVPHDRRKEGSKLTSLGWQVLTFYKLKEDLLQLKRLSSALE